MQNDKHYHTIPADEWQSKWLPMEERLRGLQREIDNKKIEITINRKHHPMAIFDDRVKVGYLNLSVDLPAGIELDEDYIRIIKQEHADCPFGFIYSEKQAKHLAQELMDKIALADSIQAATDKRARYIDRIMWILAALLIANLYIVYNYYL